MVGQECFTEALLEGAREVFETMMFMTVEESDDPQGQITGHAFLGSITFKGAIEGCVSICCGQACAEIVARNMLAMEPDEEISEDEIEDAIGEVANMVMGAVKAKIMDAVGDVQVSIPSVVSGTELESSVRDCTDEILLNVKLDEEAAQFGFLYRESSE
jgi:chemotaxis protein CheX